MIKKIATLACVFVLTSAFSIPSQAELYTNFYNNTKEALKITKIVMPSDHQTNANFGIEIKPQPNGYPPHIWFKANSHRSGPYCLREITVAISSALNPKNFCLFTIPYTLDKYGREDFSGSYRIDSYGDFHCYLNDRNGNTAHLNLDRKK